MSRPAPTAKYSFKNGLGFTALVNDEVVSKDGISKCYPAGTLISIYTLSGGDNEGCVVGKSISFAGSVPLNGKHLKGSLLGALSDTETQNNITLSEIKKVDSQFIRTKLNQYSQALAGFNLSLGSPWTRRPTLALAST